MSEIYLEKLAELGPVYRAKSRALESAIDESLDSERFTEDEMKTNLHELGQIAESANMTNYYLGLLFERVVKKEE